MITYEYIKEAQDFLIENWGNNGKKVIAECAKVKPFNDDFDAFLKHCTCCGGNWGGMLLTGINELYSNVYDAIPDDMGISPFCCLLYTLLLCGVDTTEKNEKKA